MKATEGLIGRRVEITVSDPWDFVTDHGSGPFAAVVEHVEGACLLIRLQNSIAYGQQVFSCLVVTPSAECDDLEDLAVAGQTVNSGLVGILDDAARSDHPCDLRSWRGGLALLGSIRSVDEAAPRRD